MRTYVEKFTKARWITKEEECIGKYATRAKAQRVAKTQTLATGVKHHVLLTHYVCPYTFNHIICWTIIISKRKDNYGKY